PTASLIAPVAQNAAPFPSRALHDFPRQPAARLLSARNLPFVVPGTPSPSTPRRSRRSDRTRKTLPSYPAAELPAPAASVSRSPAPRLSRSPRPGIPFLASTSQPCFPESLPHLPIPPSTFLSLAPQSSLETRAGPATSPLPLPNP